MNIFYAIMDSMVRGTIYGFCLTFYGYTLFRFIRFLFRKCRQLAGKITPKNKD